MTNDELIKLYLKPGLELLSHPEPEIVLKTMRERGIMDQAKAIAHNRASNHVATYGNYRT
jgi:hypothetical protein